MMPRSDYEDDTRLVVSPKDFLWDSGFDESMTLARNIVMLHTGSAIPYITRTYSVREYPFTVPGFLSNPPVYRLEEREDFAGRIAGRGA